MEKPEQKQGKSVVQNVLIAIVLLLMGGAGYLMYQNSQLQAQLVDCGQLTNSVEAERDLVMGDLKSLAGEYDSLMTDNDSINTELVAQKEKVDKLMAEAKKNNWSIYKLKKEAATLREIMKGYVRTIDSLNTENIELRAENLDVKNQLGAKENENEQLRQNADQLQNKVQLGAKLKAIDMMGVAQIVKKNNTHKETKRADKAEKIRVCFTLDKNEVTEPGKKMIYLRIETPQGTVLAERSDKAHMFDFEGTEGLFSVQKEVNYENERLDLCMYWDVINKLSSGTYTVKAYCAGLEIGSSSITLK